MVWHAYKRKRKEKREGRGRGRRNDEQQERGHTNYRDGKDLLNGHDAVGY